MHLPSRLALFALATLLGMGVSVSAQPAITTDDPSADKPMHLLILFFPGTSRPSDSVILKSLQAVPSQSWLVNVERADGNMTGYADKMSLRRALDASSASDLAFERSVGKALLDLKQHPQNSVLVIDLAGSHRTGLRAWAEPIVQAHVPVYLVDGGKKMQVAYNNSWGSMNGPTPDTNNFGYEVVTKKGRYFKNGLVHEVKLKDALKDVVKYGAHGFTMQSAQTH